MQLIINMKSKIITLGHGSGAGLTRELIKDLFQKEFNLPALDDAVEIDKKMVITTDSHVIRPLFYPGGDIGKLSVTGTVNDLSMKGAVPKYLLITYIIEEGFSINDLKKITASVQKASEQAGVKIVGGDTKVVEKGKADGLYITTSGIGFLKAKVNISSKKIKAGDKIIINGTIGDHTIAIINIREKLDLKPVPQSDCAPLNYLVQKIIKAGDVKFMRDPTRGGVATVLNEVCEETGLGIIIDEKSLPVNQGVSSVCDLLGLDLLYLANEGKVLVIADENNSDKLVKVMKKDKLGKDSGVIGEVTNKVKGVYVKTEIGGLRPLPMLESDPLPRIC